MNLSTEQKETHRYRKQIYGCLGGWRRDGLGVQDQQMQTTIYIIWINNKFLLGNTGNYVKYLVISHNGKEYLKRIYIYTHMYN